MTVRLHCRLCLFHLFTVPLLQCRCAALRPTGFEPATSCSGGKRSIQMKHQRAVALIIITRLFISSCDIEPILFALALSTLISPKPPTIAPFCGHSAALGMTPSLAGIEYPVSRVFSPGKCQWPEKESLRSFDKKGIASLRTSTSRTAVARPSASDRQTSGPKARYTQRSGSGLTSTISNHKESLYVCSHGHALSVFSRAKQPDRMTDEAPWQ